MSPIISPTLYLDSFLFPPGGCQNRNPDLLTMADALKVKRTLVLYLGLCVPNFPYIFVPIASYYLVTLLLLEFFKLRSLVVFNRSGWQGIGLNSLACYFWRRKY